MLKFFLLMNALNAVATLSMGIPLYIAYGGGSILDVFGIAPLVVVMIIPFISFIYLVTFLINRRSNKEKGRV